MKKKSSSQKSTKRKIMSTELDTLFDEGKSIIAYADLDQSTFRVNVDFPAWSVKALDSEASRRGITRQALIKFWIIERLDQLPSKNSGSR